MTDSGTTSPGEALVASTAVLALGAGIVAFAAHGLEAAALVLALGWLVVVPLLAILAEAFGPASLPRGGTVVYRALGAEVDRDDTDAALDALRRRYARGDVDEAEFERRLERLLRTETEEQARRAVDGNRDEDTAGERETERERESEREL